MWCTRRSAYRPGLRRGQLGSVPVDQMLAGKAVGQGVVQFAGPHTVVTDDLAELRAALDEGKEILPT